MGRDMLLIAALLTALAALAHLGCIVFGAPWYRFMGAGERMARMAEAGSPRPALITAVITLVLLVWTMYALSGAGWLAPLPFLQPVLWTVSALLMLRALGGFVLAAVAPGANGWRFWIWSSALCLLLAISYTLGTASIAQTY